MFYCLLYNLNQLANLLVGKTFSLDDQTRRQKLHSLDEFLWKRKEEYSRYFYASYYKPGEVKHIFDEVTGLTKDDQGRFVQGEARKNL